MVNIIHFAPLFLVFTTALAQSNPYRLGPTVTPSNYALELTIPEVSESNALFSGSVQITVAASALVTIFDLQTINITINSLVLYDTEDEEQGDLIDTYGLNSTYNDKVTIRLKTDLVVGHTYIISSTFTGILHDDMLGIYRSSYKDANNNIKWLAATQFQPTNARRALPCFDEPNFKATFQLSIIHPQDLHALSNTPITSTQVYNATLGLNKTTFQKTPKMSTYLLSFIISDLTGLTNTSINYGVYSPPNLINTAEYAFEVGPKLLTEMENFLNDSYSNYGIGKLDLVAIPDLSAGAMENWGLTTYRECLLLYDPDGSSLKSRRAIVAAIMKNIAQSWFGNLVTCEWWSLIWINEGFGTYFQYFGAALVETEMDLDKVFVVEQLQAAFASDASASSPSLTVDVTTQTEIDSKFSVISYSKGASIIRMVKHILGKENWRLGLIDYLSVNQLAAGTPVLLYAAWNGYNQSVPSELPLTTILDSWADVGGFPLLKVSLSGNDTVITQQQFLLNSSESSSSEWYVPITYTTSQERNFENTTPSYWLVPGQNLTISNILNGASGWVILNLQQTGYYRVTYDEELWSQLANGLQKDNFDGIPDLNRAQIVDDVLALARARQVSYVDALNTVSFLSKDTSYYPWYSAFTAFSYLKTRYQTNATLGTYFKVHLLELMDSLYSNVSFIRASSESYVEVDKTEFTLKWACDLGHTDCIQKAQDLYKSLRNDNTAVNPDVRSVVYCTALKYSDDSDDWYFLWNKLTEETLASEISIIISALGCSKNESLLNEYMTLALNSSSGIRNQDVSSVFSSVVSSNPEGVDVTLNYVEKNYQSLIDYFQSTSTLLSVLSNVADRMTSETQIQNLESWISENSDSLSSISSSVEGYITSARNNLLWDQECSDELDSFYVSYFEQAMSAASSAWNISKKLLFIWQSFFIIYYNVSLQRLY